MSGRPRTIDYEAVTRMRESGLSIAECARRLGISDYAVRYASDPEFRARTARTNSERRYWAVPCPGCGNASACRHREGALCRTCRAKETTTTVREDTLLCSTCGEWKPDDQFSPQSARITRRGRGHACNPCEAIRKREARRQKSGGVTISLTVQGEASLAAAIAKRGSLLGVQL
jgi:hypothetical protein